MRCFTCLLVAVCLCPSMIGAQDQPRFEHIIFLHFPSQATLFISNADGSEQSSHSIHPHLDSLRNVGLPQ
jgi:hypothetical protein